jgi:hypothetical protein
LRYRLSLLNDKVKLSMATEVERPTTNVQIPSSKESDLSPLTYDNMAVIGSHLDISNAEETDDGSTTGEIKRGRKKGSTKKAKSEYLQKISKTKPIVAEAFNKAKEEATENGTKVAGGYLNSLIQSTIDEFGLKAGCIKRNTIFSRIRRQNMSGVAHQKVSPFMK